jgi:hypothetical protein
MLALSAAQVEIVLALALKSSYSASWAKSSSAANYVVLKQSILGL